MFKTALLTAGLLGLAASQASAISFNFGSVTGGQIVFDGAGNFSFQQVIGPGIDEFAIDNTSGTGDSLADRGDISGTFSIGTIITSGTTQSAPVTGTGTVTIRDGALGVLTGTVEWDRISTTGTGSTLNVLGKLNLTSINYTGSEADWSALAAAGAGYETVTFQFIPAVTLTALKTGQYQNSFSGAIVSAVPDSGMSLGLLGLGLATIGYGCRFRR